MQVTTALLCDFAEVREDLLFIVAGGITRLWREEFPAAMGVSLALVLELHRMERDRPHEFEIEIVDEDGVAVAKAQGGFQQPSGPGVDAHEATFLPITLDLRNIGLAHAGWHSIEISIDAHHERSLRFLAGPRPQPPVASPPEAPPG